MPESHHWFLSWRLSSHGRLDGSDNGNYGACVSFPAILRALYLDDSHVEAGLPRQLLPDVSRRFRCSRKSRFQGLQLFGFYGGARPASFPDGALLVVLVATNVLIGQVSRFRVLAVVLWVLRVRRHTGIAACGYWGENETLRISTPRL